MDRKHILSVVVVIAVALVFAGGVWLVPRSRKLPPPLAKPSATVGGESSGDSSAVRVRRPTGALTQAVSTARTAGGSARAAGGSSAQPASAPTFTAPRDFFSAVRDALSRDDKERLRHLLGIIRSDPAAHVSAIVSLALDEAIPATIRATMIELMRGLRDSASLRALLDLSTDTANATLRAESLKALGARREDVAQERLQNIASDPADPAHAMAISLLGTEQDVESRRLLRAELENPAASDETKNAALYGLRHYPDAETVASLLAIAADAAAPARHRATALYSLGVIGDDAALPAIKANLQSDEREVRYSAALAATRVSDASVTEVLVPSLCDIANYPHVRKAASAALAENATPQDLETLRASIHTTDGFGIRLACDVFEAKGDPAAVPILRALSQEISDDYVLKQIEATITAIQKQGDQ